MLKPFLMTRVHSRIILIVGVALPRATSLRPHISAAALSELVCGHFHLELDRPVCPFGVALTDVVLVTIWTEEGYLFGIFRTFGAGLSCA